MSEYTKQAKKFLEDTNTKFEVVVIGKLLPPWAEEGAKPSKTLSVTLSNDRHTYNFKFYCSLHDTYGPEVRTSRYCPEFIKAARKWNKDQRKNTYEYDILACLNVSYCEDHEDFCDEFGYDIDSIRGRDVYLAVQKESKNLKRLFTEEQLEQLNEIA